MELFTVYLTHSLDLLNGVTAFCVLQSLAFVYWNQSDDFKDSVKFEGHVYSFGVTIVFAVIYCVAIYVITRSQVDLIRHLSDPGTEMLFLKTKLSVAYLKKEAWISMRYRLAVVVLFHLLSLAALVRYFLGQYTLPENRVAP
jgi:hypothetical protein